ncbi:hypothetical protein ACFQ0M_01145 [Kitasatospora aburaviensis]
MFELRYQISITAPPNIVALSDKTMRGYRTLVDKLNSGQVYNSWDELRSDCQEWFDALRDLRHEMRADLAQDDPEHPESVSESPLARAPARPVRLPAAGTAAWGAAGGRTWGREGRQGAWDDAELNGTAGRPPVPQ